MGGNILGNVYRTSRTIDFQMKLLAGDVPDVILIYVKNVFKSHWNQVTYIFTIYIEMSNLHDHILVNVIPPHNGWKCSGIKLYGSCLLGDGYFPRGTLAWRCPKCDFDLCEKCFQKSLTSGN